MKRLMLALMLAALTGCHKKHGILQLGKPCEDQPSGKALFVIMGHSNASGRASITSQANNNRITMFANDNTWKRAYAPEDDSVHEVSIALRDPYPGGGPGIPFAQALLGSQPGMNIGLIPCGRGGTTLTDWAYHKDLYGDCEERVKLAQLSDPDSHIAGILVFLGENDEAPEDSRRSPSTYRTDFIGWLNHVKLQFHAPILWTRVGTATIDPDFPNYQVIRDAQDQINFEGATRIDTDDVDRQDLAHFSERGYQQLADKFVKAYLNTFCD